jgi:hypothetical protein
MKVNSRHLFDAILNKWYFAVSLFTVIVYFRAAPLQVDPHHDGVIHAAAVAVAEGHPILSGAFSQYGPLPSLIQGFVLWVFDTQLITLRFLTAVQCLAIGLALYRLGLEFTTKLSARFLSFTWLLASCIWVTEFPGSMLPWPSILSTLFVLSALILIIKADQENKSHYAYLAGILFASAGLCRIQAFILLPMVIAAGLVKYQLAIKNLLFSMAGYTTSLILMFGYLATTGGIDDFIQQVITTPIFTYSGIGQDNNYNRFQFALYLIEAVGFMVLYFSTRYILKRIESQAIVVAALTIVLFGIHTFGVWIANTTIPIRLKVLIGEPLQNLVISPFYFAVISSIYLTTAIILKGRRVDGKNSFPKTVVIVCAFGTLPQLYPQSDVMHLWWIAPIFLPSIFIVFGSFQSKYSQESPKVLQAILVSCMILGSTVAVQFIDRPWSEYKLEVLRGTYAHNEKVQSVDIFKAIEKYATRGETSFDCADGIYAVADGTYLASDQWFVNWGFNEDTKPIIGTTRIICDQSKSYALSESNKLTMKLVYFKTNSHKKSIAILQKKE